MRRRTSPPTRPKTSAVRGSTRPWCAPYKAARNSAYTEEMGQEVVRACIAYNKGKKSIRTFQSGRERFETSLHLMACFADPNDPAVAANIARINEVRKTKPGDKNYVDLANYGADKVGVPTLREVLDAFDQQYKRGTPEERAEIRRTAWRATFSSRNTPTPPPP